MSGPDEVYTAARVVLLDALAALGPHRDAAILVGAQAIYLRVGEADIAVAPTTTDGDLALDPDQLGVSPEIHGLMEAAGFQVRRRMVEGPLPGIWEKRGTNGYLVSVDLLVPEGVASREGRRAARLEGQRTGVAMKVRGIEGALVDHDHMSIADVADRSFTIRVAGPAALLVAKVHKLLDRSETAERLKDKDALDVFRLLRGSTTDDLVSRTEAILADRRSADVGRSGLVGLRELFGRQTAHGVRMAIRATQPLMDEREVSGSLIALTTDFLRALESR